MPKSGSAPREGGGNLSRRPRSSGRGMRYAGILTLLAMTSGGAFGVMKKGAHADAEKSVATDVDQSTLVEAAQLQLQPNLVEEGVDPIEAKPLTATELKGIEKTCEDIRQGNKDSVKQVLDLIQGRTRDDQKQALADGGVVTADQQQLSADIYRRAIKAVAKTCGVDKKTISNFFEERIKNGDAQFASVLKKSIDSVCSERWSWLQGAPEDINETLEVQTQKIQDVFLAKLKECSKDSAAALGLNFDEISKVASHQIASEALAKRDKLEQETDAKAGQYRSYAAVMDYVVEHENADEIIAFLGLTWQQFDDEYVLNFYNKLTPDASVDPEFLKARNKLDEVHMQVQAKIARQAK